MKNLLVFLLLIFLIGCGVASTESHYIEKRSVKVGCKPNQECPIDAIKNAIYFWNYHIGLEVFNYSEDFPEISIWFEPLVGDQDDYVATARMIDGGCQVRIDPKEFDDLQEYFEIENYRMRILAHEFGHCIGLNHDPNPSSLMHELISEDAQITPRLFELIWEIFG